MQSGNLIKMAVGAALGVLLLCTLALPLITSATATTDTVKNTGYYTMAEYEPTDTFTAKWEYSKPAQITVNGDVVQLPATAGTFPYTVIGGADIMVRLLIEGNTKYFQAWPDPTASTVYQARTSGGGSNMEITLSGGVLTFDNGSGTTKSVTLTDSFYCATNNGEYVLKAYNETAYILDDSELIAIGASTINTSGQPTGQRFCIVGNVTDGFTASSLPNEITIGTITATYTDSANTNFVDLLDFSKLEFTVTYDGADTDVIYSQMLAPAEVTAEKAVHLDSTEITMLELIPLLFAVALVLGIIAYAIRARLS